MARRLSRGPWRGCSRPYDDGTLRCGSNQTRSTPSVGGGSILVSTPGSIPVSAKGQRIERADNLFVAHLFGCLGAHEITSAVRPTVRSRLEAVDARLFDQRPSLAAVLR
jgi:hypothetical protein